jgi:hypothetical protein
LARTIDIPAKVAAPAKLPAKRTFHHSSDINEHLHEVWLGEETISSHVVPQVQYRFEFCSEQVPEALEMI